jgi:hypothetical protein
MSHHAVLLALVLAGATAACGPSSAPTRPVTPAPEGAQASAYVSSFRTTWTTVLPTLKPELADWGTRVDSLIRDPHGPLEARTELCRTRLAFIRSHISEIASLVVHGALAGLDRDGACGVVDVNGGEKSEAEGVLSSDGSEVLLIWVVPEG